MEYAIAKVSTKGQIVIPIHMRKKIKTGDEFLIIRDGERLLLKSMDTLTADLKDDLIFAERVENAWQDYDKGKFKKKSKEDFLKELKSC
ncbi:MAG: AbrB/MazE/SpoVT family DNA-binding domain-containing protein [Nanoarchaeota archaeon]